LNSPENWAERAAELGWDARALFGCHRNYPLMHLGSAGLLWAINGGKPIKRDYVRVNPCPDADTVMHQLSAWITHYNEVHPHKALGKA
jgi:hypothetical protein